MSRIQRLPQSVVNKIAAGEVIERPASLVKELMENSLDAGATRVDVTVEQGGIELVRVVDDGCGIDAGELPLAVASHATSKLASADDLFQVRTLGFRGEALASIAEVSHFLLRSRVRAAADVGGAQIEVAGGQVGQVMPAAAPEGTTIEVRNLFFNTPVRRKFLRSTQTEIGHVSEAFARLALAHPKVHFTLRHNARVLYELPPADDWRERIGTFFGADLADDLLWVESDDGPVRLAGYAAHPKHTRSNPRSQYIFLNGRFIRDRSLQHALAEAYRGLVMSGRYPVAFLACTMPAEQVDVNVHPTKLEVRFQDAGRLYSQLLGTLRTRFLTTNLTHRLSAQQAAGQPRTSAPTDHSAEAASHAAQRSSDGSASAETAPSAEPLADEALAGWLRQQVGGWQPAQGKLFTRPGDDAASRTDSPHGAPHLAAEEIFPPRAAREPLALNSIRDYVAAAPHREDAADRAPRHGDAQPAWPRTPASRAPMIPSTAKPTALQIHNCYLVAESEEGIVVIDQHALHERILYEQLRATVLSGSVESQQLLVPEPVDLSAQEASLVLDHRELLAELGLMIEPFGGDTVLVSAYPAMLDRAGPREILREVVDHLSARGRAPERRDLLDEILHMVACKAAIKAGDRLSPPEIDALLAERHLAQDTHHCPHGRPTSLVFTREDLDKQFKRT